MYLIDNSIDRDVLNVPKSKMLDRWSNPEYIHELLIDNPKKFQRERRIIKEIQSDYSTKGYHKIINDLIVSKVDELLDIDQKTWMDLILQIRD